MITLLKNQIATMSLLPNYSWRFVRNKSLYASIYVCEWCGPIDIKIPALSVGVVLYEIIYEEKSLQKHYYTMLLM